MDWVPVLCVVIEYISYRSVIRGEVNEHAVYLASVKLTLTAKFKSSAGLSVQI